MTAPLKLAAIALLVLAAACSPKRVAVTVIGNAIAGETSVYLSDSDPELVREAIPFGLKTYEGLLEITPGHRNLLLSAASGFVSYAYLVALEAERLDPTDYAEAQRLRKRARALYLRGRDYALRGLALKTPDFAARLKRETETVLSEVEEKDVPFLYWAAAGQAGALSVDKEDAQLIADLPLAGAMMERVIALEPGFNNGAAYEFMVNYEGTRPGGDPEKARAYYDKALEYSNGGRASVHLALAESVVVEEQDAAEFRRLLQKARAVDPDAEPEIRLLNVIAHRRAAWLSQRIPDLFLEY